MPCILASFVARMVQTKPQRKTVETLGELQANSLETNFFLSITDINLVNKQTWPWLIADCLLDFLCGEEPGNHVQATALISFIVKLVFPVVNSISQETWMAS